MTTTPEHASTDRELVLTRTFRAPPERVFDAWTDPEQLAKWWAPPGFTTPVCEIDPRPGGVFRTVMRDGDGKEYDEGAGVFLEVVRPERIVFTDALAPGWWPNPSPFMTVVVTLERADGGTRYTARARHWTVEDRAKHEEMGFHEGWGATHAQLADLVEG